MVELTNLSVFAILKLSHMYISIEKIWTWSSYE